MAHYLLRWKFAESSAKNFVQNPQDRTAQATGLITSFGGKMSSYYFSFGDYDGVAICEFPDNIAAAACSMTASATGAFARFETTTLLTGQEAESAMRKAKETRTNYQPPHTASS